MSCLSWSWPHSPPLRSRAGTVHACPAWLQACRVGGDGLQSLNHGWWEVVQGGVLGDILFQRKSQTPSGVSEPRLPSSSGMQQAVKPSISDAPINFMPCRGRSACCCMEPHAVTGCVSATAAGLQAVHRLWLGRLVPLQLSPFTTVMSCLGSRLGLRWLGAGRALGRPRRGL